MNTTGLKREQLKKELFTFLIITFTATYALQLIIFAIAGYISYPLSNIWATSLAVSMFIPATVAIFCMSYFRSQALTRETKIIFTFFLVYAILFAFENYYQPILGTVMEQPLLSMMVAIWEC